MLLFCRSSDWKSGAPNREGYYTDLSRTNGTPTLSTATLSAHDEGVLSITERLGRRQITKKKQTKGGAGKEVVVKAEEIVGHKGEADLDNILQFLDEPNHPSKKKGAVGGGSGKTKGNSNNGKKGSSGGKEKDTLVKSASLDENHLNQNPNKGLAETEKKSEKAVSSTTISSLTVTSQPHGGGRNNSQLSNQRQQNANNTNSKNRTKNNREHRVRIKICKFLFILVNCK